MIKSVHFALDQVAFEKNVSYSDSDSNNKPDFFDSELSDTGGSGLKILTPNQILSRFPITLSQLKISGNNSEKLKNEIRQLLYCLYRSKKLTKQLHKSLVSII